MPPLFNIDVLTPEMIVYRGKIESLIVPAEFGYLGVLANHASLIAHLVAGKIIIKDNSGAILTFNSSGQGFIEVINNQATLILDSVVSPLEKAIL